MLTALILLSIAIGLKHIGVEMPFVDNVIDFAKTKLNKIKGNENNVVKNEIKEPANMTDIPFKAKKQCQFNILNTKPYSIKNNPNIYYDSLKI